MSIKPQRDLLALRSEIIATCRRLDAIGLNQGTSGNVSVRIAGDRFLVTPTGIPYDVMTEDEIAEVTFDGAYHGPRRPSSEWRFHRDILARRPDVDTVIHTPCDVLDDHRLPAPGDSGVPLHDRRGRRQQHPLRRLCHVRQPGARRQRPQGARGPAGLPACQPRRDRHRAGACRSPRGCSSRWRRWPPSIGASCNWATPIVLDDAEMAKVVELFKTYGKQDAPDGELRHGGSLSARA